MGIARRSNTAMLCCRRLQPIRSIFTTCRLRGASREARSRHVFVGKATGYESSSRILGCALASGDFKWIDCSPCWDESRASPQFSLGTSTNGCCGGGRCVGFTVVSGIARRCVAFRPSCQSLPSTASGSIGRGPCARLVHFERRSPLMRQTTCRWWQRCDFRRRARRAQSGRWADYCIHEPPSYGGE